ncbi:tail fiber protein [Salmonella enterica subsp. enterica serovar Javiana]|nr:tail fiber protein [Salmonella enterica subsp. enterica serovar Javiana]ELF4283966.1 tail fiber protein [Salmonella enterica]
MAKNDFKPFATGKGANVTSQSDWEALPALLSGFTAGKASSAQVNKALRQASFIAAALAQYTASKSGQDVLDDGDLSGFIAKMSAAFGKDFQTLDATLTALAGLATGADKLPYFTGNDTAGQTDLTSVGRDIIGKPSIADILTYLGLGETVNQAAGAMQKSQNGADIPDTALFRQSIGVYDASTSQKGLVRLNGGVSNADDTLGATSGAVKIAYDTAISAANIAKTKWSAVDATISQKGIVMLSDNTGVPDSATAATTTAVNYVLKQAIAAYSLAESKYTAEGATTGKAGLVQLVNSMGGSGSLVMSQEAVTTAIQTYPSLGKGQTLQDLRGSRSIDATYTNSTGFPIAVYVRVSGGYSAGLYTYVNGIEFGGGGSTASNTSIATAFFIVPNGATYRVTATGASPALQAWAELR